MRKLTYLSALLASAGFWAPALADNEGMGDPAAHLRQMNAICELQRRGQAPLTPNLCLPEDPPIARRAGR